MSVTFKDIITAFEAYTISHPQLNGFGWGDISNINPTQLHYPAIWLNPMNSFNNGNLSILKFDMYMLDILEQDRSNLLDVMNSTLILGNDTVAQFWLDEGEGLGFDLDETKVSLIPFEGRFDHLLGSWIFTIEIQLRTNLNQCAIPTG